MASGGASRRAGPFRVLIVDDHPIVRSVVRMACDATPVLEVVGEAGDGHAALEAWRRLSPDVMVLDLIIPGLDGIEVVRRVRSEGARTRILVLTGRIDGDAVLACMRAGVDGFLAKTAGVADIAWVLERVARGERVFPKDQERLAVQELGRLVRAARQEKEAAPLLTDRELEVLRLLAQGLTMQQVGSRLSISPRTVESHASRLYRKLGARTRVQAMSAAAAMGLLELD